MLIEEDGARETLERRLLRKLPTIKAANDFDLRGKLLRYALGLGYDYDLVVEVIDAVTKRT
jgi:regulatory protein